MCQYISAAFYFLSAEFYNHWLNKPTEFETFRKHMHSMWVQIYILYLLLHIKSTWFCWRYWYLVNYLRNQSHIFFLVDRGINQKRMENCINTLSALLQKFSVLFSVDTSINRKNIRLISYHLIFIAFQQRKRSF